MGAPPDMGRSGGRRSPVMASRSLRQRVRACRLVAIPPAGGGVWRSPGSVFLARCLEGAWRTANEEEVWCCEAADDVMRRC